ncbi:MAG: MBL fold metallo-hydrolase [Thermoproteota archaeon]
MNLTKLSIELPIRALGYVNVYLSKGADGIWLFDTGMFHIESAHSLISRIREIGLQPCRIAGIVITHFHVDHSTLTPLLYELSRPDVYIGSRELEAVLSIGVDAYIEEALKIFRESGMPEAEVESIRRYHPALRAIEAYEKMARLPWKGLREGDRVEVNGLSLQVVEAPGHTPGHIVLAGEEEIVLGDTVLSNITPHVTIHFMGSNPLGDYIKTLHRLERIAEGKLGLPGHREVIGDVRKRVREILHHHAERLAEIVKLIHEKGSLTGYSVARSLKWRVRYRSWEEYPPPEKFFAMGEALAHLALLEALGAVEAVTIDGSLAWKLTANPEDALSIVRRFVEPQEGGSARMSSS